MKRRDDFLQIILEDETTRDNNELIVDECLTFFFAGTQTSNLTSQNLVYMLCKHPKYAEKILQELESVIIQPYLKEQVAAGKLQAGAIVNGLDLLDLMHFDNSGDLTFYSCCFNESLRMQPPVYFSSSNRVLQECKSDTLSIRRDSMFSIDMHRLGNNPDEWIEPGKFIPERFDPKSSYFLTPKGKTRNPFSFSPFLGGQRICIGKTFIEAVSKVTVPTLLYYFKLELLDEIDPQKFEMPHNNMLMKHTIKLDLLMTAVSRKHTHKVTDE